MQSNGLALIDEAVRRYNPRAVFALFSGGHDSLTATHIASGHPAFTGAAHMNTGIGIKETREFVRATCARNGWMLEERSAADCGQVYRDLVIEHGFPGPGHHYKMYQRLKERPLRSLIRDYKTHVSDRILLVSGCRSQESVRRMGHVEPIQHEGAYVWVAPIHDWSKVQCNEYIREHGLERNPVVDLLHMSGECLCGAYVDQTRTVGPRTDEFRQIEEWFPAATEEIKGIEREVLAAGKPWLWDDERPPEWYQDAKRGQTFAFQMDDTESKMMMCQSCEKRAEEEDDATE